MRREACLHECVHSHRRYSFPAAFEKDDVKLRMVAKSTTVSQGAVVSLKWLTLLGYGRNVLGLLPHELALNEALASNSRIILKAFDANPSAAIDGFIFSSLRMFPQLVQTVEECRVAVANVFQLVKSRLRSRIHYRNPIKMLCPQWQEPPLLVNPHDKVSTMLPVRSRNLTPPPLASDPTHLCRSIGNSHSHGSLRSRTNGLRVSSGWWLLVFEGHSYRLHVAAAQPRDKSGATMRCRPNAATLQLHHQPIEPSPRLSALPRPPL